MATSACLVGAACPYALLVEMEPAIRFHVWNGGGQGAIPRQSGHIHDS